MSKNVFFFIISYIFVTNRVFEVPVLFTYDYLALAYIFFVIDSFKSLKKNFFSKKSIFLLIIGGLIFEYLGFMYFGTIVLYNFFRHNFKYILFQIKHLFLAIPPLVVILIFYISIMLNPELVWTAGRGDIEIESRDMSLLWREYGQFNDYFMTLISMVKYSLILIFTSLIYLFIKIKYKNPIDIFINEDFKILTSLIVVFLFILSVGNFTSAFSEEWERQFLPFLFLSSTLSCLLINKIYLFLKKIKFRI